MKILIYFLPLILSFTFFNIFEPNSAFAQTADSPGSATIVADPVPKIDNPLGSDNPNILIGNIIKQALGVVGSLALVMFVVSGFMWMSASGNPERVNKAKGTMIWTALGLVVIFSAYAIVKFIIEEVATGT